MSMDPELTVFVEECDELLAEMETCLLACEQGSCDASTINSIFRAAHTIKGSAGLFGLDFVVGFVHDVETALDQVRVGAADMNQPFAILLLKCCDHINMLVASVKQGATDADENLKRHGKALSSELQSMIGTATKGVTSNDSAVAAARPEIKVADGTQGVLAATDDWHLSIRFARDVLRNGMDPLSFLRYLKTFGEFRHLHMLTDALRPGEEWDPEACYVGFEARYHSDATEQRIVDAFEFVREDCVLSVIAPHSPLQSYLKALDTAGEGADGYPHLLTVGTLTAAELELAMQQPVAAIGITASVNTSKSVSGARPSDSNAEARTVRIDASKLDSLITLVGELIIAAASTSLGAKRTRDIELQESASQLSDLVEQVRDSALQLRMVKIGSTFNRFHRVVNDTARELGKSIRLVITGEDTELDKTVVEKIADPLTHLVRNAIDHGICMPDERLKNGKPVQGTVTLNAYHDSGHIVIEVGDDGKGLDRDRILQKAVERGLVPPGVQLSDKDIYALIFEPGFSTAEKVTNISGRGVGMDVVRRNITALRGTIDVRSVEGHGSTFVIRLPLTLAIINGFQVSVGKSVFVVPVEMVDECIEYSSDGDHDYTNVRGSALPFIRLHDVLSVKRRQGARENIVIVRSGGQRAGLVVDGLLGECQTVIKPLSKIFNQAKCISGSSILGNGEVALILDVPALIQRALEEVEQKMPPPSPGYVEASSELIH